MVSVTALDLPPARYRDYDVGDSLWLESYETGFDEYAATVRVTAREFLPGQNVCSLVIE